MYNFPCHVQITWLFLIICVCVRLQVFHIFVSTSHILCVTCTISSARFWCSTSLSKFCTKHPLLDFVDEAVILVGTTT